MYEISDLNNKLVGELKDIAKKLNIENYDALKKQDLITKILELNSTDNSKMENGSNEQATFK